MGVLAADLIRSSEFVFMQLGIVCSPCRRIYGTVYQEKQPRLRLLS